MANSFDDSPKFGPYPPATPTSTEIQRIIEQVRLQAEAEAREKYEMALHEHVEKLKRAPLVDELKDLVSYGDIVIRKVGNGYIIRRIPGSYMNPADGRMIETWVVEGNDIKGAADQLTAIQADDAISNQAKNTLASGQNLSMNTAPARFNIHLHDRELREAIDASVMGEMVDRVKIGPMVKLKYGSSE